MKTSRGRKTRLKQIVILLIVFLYSIMFNKTNEAIAVTENVEDSNTTVSSVANEQSSDLDKKYIFISDMDYITDNNWSYNGWSGHEIQKDKNPDGGTITLKINGNKESYLKGMGVHAKGQLTYDVSQYSDKYTRFVAKIGVDASRTASSSLWFRISTSTDGVNWNELTKTGLLTYQSEAIDVDVNIEGAMYLRIYVDPNGSNAADHGVIADAKIVTADYNPEEGSYTKVHKLEYYDNILSQQTPEYNIENNYRLILEREFVNKIGYREIQQNCEIYPEYEEVLDWIFNEEDISVLEQCIQVGAISNKSKFLSTISTLYNTYKDDLKTENGWVYQKMLIALATGYSSDTVATPTTFGHHAADYDVIERFRLMKQLFDTNKLHNTNLFKNLQMELMRNVMNDGVRDDEFIWLNSYSKTKNPKFDHWQYVKSVETAVDQNAFYKEANRSKYDQKYKLSANNVPYGDSIKRYWMVSESGGVCWNISRFIESVYRVNGIPVCGGYQPGHEPYVSYSVNSAGKGIWTLNYSMKDGWAVLGTTWGGGNRFRYPLDWANKPYADQTISGPKGGTSSGYIILAQANLNDYENYYKSVCYNILANSYTNNEDKLNAYNKALEKQKLNLDTYDGIIATYRAMGDEVSYEEWYQLANKILDAYTYYPPASYDLIQSIKSDIKDVDSRLAIEQKLINVLQRAANANSSNSLQYEAVRELANELLGKPRAELATFSFDGENARCIVLDKSYDSYDFLLSYSIDGGKTYSEPTQNHIIQLSKEECERITPTNDIKLEILGITLNHTTIYPIDIVAHSAAIEPYGNDLENKIIGEPSEVEWHYGDKDASSEWILLQNEQPDLTGEAVVSVRLKATGREVAGKVTTYTFTKNNEPNTRKYVPVSRISVTTGSNSGTSGRIIDANYNSVWQSDPNNTTSKYIEFEFDEPIYLSAIEYIPGPGEGTQNGRLVSGTFANPSNAFQKVSTGTQYYTYEDNTLEEALKDMKKFTVSKTFTGKVKKIRFTWSTLGKDYLAVRAFNFYQDITKEPAPTAAVNYSTTEPTNQDVVVTLANKNSSDVKVTNNGGSETYTFTENGSFTFELENKYGKTGRVTATVNWIDKEVPTAEIEYSTTDITDQPVTATLKPSEEVTILNNEGNDTYTFTENGEFTFEFEDKAGNRGTAKATVDWIEKRDISSSKYQIEGNMIVQIIPVTTVKEFKENITTDKDFVITNKKGKALTDKDKITTDSKLIIDGVTYTLIVRGDVDGNGLVNATDLSKAKQYASGKLKPTESVKRACDIDNDGQITDEDVEKLRLFILGVDIDNQ